MLLQWSHVNPDVNKPKTSRSEFVNLGTKLVLSFCIEFLLTIPEFHDSESEREYLGTNPRNIFEKDSLNWKPEVPDSNIFVSIRAVRDVFRKEKTH